MPSRPVHLYVHIPFCIHKCSYCDFNSHARTSPPWDDYQHALLQELRYWSESPLFAGRTVDTLFFGGGTPSLAPAELILNVVESATQLFTLEHDIEITLEANPGTLEVNRFSDYRDAGVNRLSIGIQSFSDMELKWLGRIHDVREAYAAYEMARYARFEQVNFDLMYGLPDQSIETWIQHLDQAISLAPEHLSCYQLTVEPHTQLAISHKQSPLALPDEEGSLNFFMQTRARLAAAGYNAYEISNFAKPGMHCRHNDGYWQYHDYIGVGAGAAGKWDTPDGGIVRYSNTRSPEAYTQAISGNGNTIAINSRETLSAAQAAAEAVWLGLRRTDGIACNEFRKRFSDDPQTMFANALSPWLKGNYLCATHDSLKLSKKGLGLADSIAASVLQSVVLSAKAC